jgi:hypothetical protein
MAYDMAALAGQRDIEYFREEFTVPMFYIVELLARRRALRRPGQLFFMNQYLTVGSELGVFRLAEDPAPGRPTPPETMQAEDKLFRELHVEYGPDYSIDSLINAVVEKVAGKPGADNLGTDNNKQ